MQLTYVFSELGNGLKRNVSMTIAVIVTIFVSLTLVGMGLLLNAQAQKAEDFWGSKLQITVFLCNQNSATANCVNGEVTDAQKDQVQQVLRTNSEVASYRLASKQEAYDKWRAAYVSNNDTERRVYSSIRPSDMQESYEVQLKDPQKFQGIKSALQGLQGVNSVRDLRSVLKPIYFWMSVMKWGAIAIAVVPGRGGHPPGGQHDQTRGVRTTARDRDHAARRCVQSLHPAAVPDGGAGSGRGRCGPGSGLDHGVHVGGHLRDAQTHLEHRRLGRLGGRRARGRLDRADRAGPDLDSDTRDDPEIPQSVTKARYRQR